MPELPTSKPNHPRNQWLKSSTAVCIEKSTLMGVGVQPEGLGKRLTVDIQGEGRLSVFLTTDAAEHLALLLRQPNT